MRSTASRLALSLLALAALSSAALAADRLTDTQLATVTAGAGAKGAVVCCQKAGTAAVVKGIKKPAKVKL